MITSDKKTLKIMRQSLCKQMIWLGVLQFAIVGLGIYIEKEATATMAYSLGKPFIFANLFVECTAIYVWIKNLLTYSKGVTLWDRVFKHDIYFAAFYIINISYCLRICFVASQVIREV